MMATRLTFLGKISRPLRLIAYAALAILLGLIPFTADGYWVRVCTNFFMFVIMVEGVNIISGYTGYAALGNVVFFGIGAYVTAILMSTFGLDFFIALILAGIVAGAFAFGLGMPILRTKGHYFVMATIGLNELVKQVVSNLDSLTGGGKGISLPIPSMPPRINYAFFYFVMLAIAIICVFVVYRLSKSKFGYGIRCIKANEQAAGVMGINTTMYKALAWTLSAFFTGLAGGVYAYWQTFIEPPVVFDVVFAIKMFLMLLLGGQGTVLGPVIGTFVVEFLGELIWGHAADLQLGILGTLVIVVVLFVPQGLVEVTRNKTIGRIFSTRRVKEPQPVEF
ncbi:MAG: branched-chain amino acid ABC transporter permease [Chloroflexi bacterium]|nr:branched-chain amino acid ABC transporter permease [Chloroflexota bacterium]